MECLRFVAVIPSFRAKSDFGDIDILVAGDEIPTEEKWEAMLVDLFSSRGISPNGPVVSVEYKDIQLDIMQVAVDDFSIALDFFSYNDLGNLIGRIADGFGISYGAKGLVVPVKVGTRFLGNFVLSKDTAQILRFLGYSPDRFFEGFNTLQDIFEFVVSSPYFCQNLYLLENRSNAQRARDSRRTTYMEFLKWLKTYEVSAACALPRSDEERSSVICAEFPEYGAFLRQVRTRLSREREIKSKFSGETIKRVLGVKAGPIVGKLLSSYRSLFTTHKEFEDFILSRSQAQIDAWVIEKGEDYLK